MNEMKPRLTVIIPCYNEEKGIAKVLSRIPNTFHERYQLEIVVVDNNSSDATAAVAHSYGATVISERRQGKGHAMLKGFWHITNEVDYVAMIDGDGSYEIQELPRLMELLESKFCDAVIGSRLHGRVSYGSMPRFNRYGNWLFTFLSRVGYETNVTDVCSGFFAWRADVVRTLRLYLQEPRFSLEMEMMAKMARLGYRTNSVPITYKLRAGKSSLHPVKDGARIMGTWLKNLSWSPERSRQSGTHRWAPQPNPAPADIPFRPDHELVQSSVRSNRSEHRGREVPY